MILVSVFEVNSYAIGFYLCLTVQDISGSYLLSDKIGTL